MLHYAHQVATNFVCLQFGAEQVVYGGFFRASLSSAVRVNKNVKLENQNNELNNFEMLSRAENCRVGRWFITTSEPCNITYNHLSHIVNINIYLVQV